MTKPVIETIDRIVKERSLLTHPFYQAWTSGDLPVESLKGYAAQYFHFEKAYPTFLSGIHHRCEDRSVRQLLLENLWDEEHGEENHVELWLRFCDALGLDRDEVQQGEPLESTRELIGTYKELTSEAPTAAGAAALYAYESQGAGGGAGQDGRTEPLLRHGQRPRRVVLPRAPGDGHRALRRREGDGNDVGLHRL